MPLGIRDRLIGKDRLENIRDRSVEFAEQMYDPSIFQPQIDTQRQLATQGIDTDSRRTQFTSQLFRSQPDTSMYGGQASTAIAATQAMDANRMSAMSDFEFGLAQMDEEVKLRATQELGKTESEARRMGAVRDAAISQADIQFETEVSNRRNKLLGTALEVGLSSPAGLSGMISERINSDNTKSIIDRLNSFLGRNKETPEREGPGLDAEQRFTNTLFGSVFNDENSPTNPNFEIGSVVPSREELALKYLRGFSPDIDKSIGTPPTTDEMFPFLQYHSFRPNF